MVVSDTVPLSTICCLTISHGGFHMGGDVLWVGQTISSRHSINLTFVVTVSQVPTHHRKHSSPGRLRLTARC
jgi:hypothetical protein